MMRKNNKEQKLTVIFHQIIILSFMTVFIVSSYFVCSIYYQTSLLIEAKYGWMVRFVFFGVHGMQAAPVFGNSTHTQNEKVTSNDDVMKEQIGIACIK